jgi:hypothetical protein
MPASRNSTLNTDHTQVRRRRVADQRLVRPVVGVGDALGFDRGAIGREGRSAAGRSVVAAHAVHQKNAARSRRCSASGTVLFFIA